MLFELSNLNFIKWKIMPIMNLQTTIMFYKFVTGCACCYFTLFCFSSKMVSGSFNFQLSEPCYNKSASIYFSVTKFKIESETRNMTH